ncbi:MAG: hypothetical protein K6F01_13055 [Selenomonas sp.]|uniref:hypothetical protein n=1 Tax=Selenomonas sp. TaxID=2053611 RepID=UPI0025EE836C|nr:hypothetical protein [Selenomonas sp.]MCR5440343.1 hypothetical protein [Selenomonas sp.]
MKLEDKVKMAEKNIWQALDDYRTHTRLTAVLDDVSKAFVKRLAKDNTYAKKELRKLFRKSPVWNEELDAMVINGTRTHNPDYGRVLHLAEEILRPARRKMTVTENTLLDLALRFFGYPEEEQQPAVDAMNKLVPKAFALNKKPSRIFRSLCEGLGVVDKSAGSDFQRLYAQFADELSSRKLDFKLYVSLNPAHFITISNPKGDDRGDTLTSCHSFNSTSYRYNNGCSGYARDQYSFIVFVAADPEKPETLNNRKTMRQIFGYMPGNGVLLQSRLYNTSGGTYGAQEDMKLYRDLVQREISELEGTVNLWQTYTYYNNSHYVIGTGEGFGGYADWFYADFDTKISIRSDHAEDYQGFKLGTYGLCIECGKEISANLYCSDCYDADDDADEMCDECEEYFETTYSVYDENGDSIRVCAACRNQYYAYCHDCGEYHPRATMTVQEDGTMLCRNCQSLRMEEGENVA